MIEAWMLDQLTDEEVLVMNALLKHKRYREIAVEMGLHLCEVQYSANQVYKKLHIYPSRPLILRSIWRNSLEFQRMEKQYKHNYVEVEKLPVGKK